MNNEELLLGPRADAPPSIFGPRYTKSMQAALYDRLRPHLDEGVRILDLGGGRNPFLPVALRPPGTRYVGTDISQEELDAAPPGAYDATFAADLTQPLPTDERFDLIISWQVLEHVADMDVALTNVRKNLVEGGRLFAQLSGRRAFFAVLTRMIPFRVRTRLMNRLLEEPEEDHFPTIYDKCLATELRPLLASWAEATVVPYFRGATYFRFNEAVARTYLVAENALAKRSKDDFATHYLVVARN